ncbi:hypothetical protein Aperf_G00000011014 [Anoplocephala perfoliata]
MRSAHIISSQGRKLPKPLPRAPVLSHHQSLVQTKIPPLARFDESESDESSDDDDTTSSYNDSIDSYFQEGIIKSSDDFRRILHQRQLMAIRPNRSVNVEITTLNEPRNFKSTQRNLLELGRRSMSLIFQLQFLGRFLSVNSSDSSSSIENDNLKLIHTNRREWPDDKPVLPPKPSMEKRAEKWTEIMSNSKGTKVPIPSSKDAEKKDKSKKDEKSLPWTAQQSQKRIIKVGRSVSFHVANPLYGEFRKMESPKTAEIVEPKWKKPSAPEATSLIPPKEKTVCDKLVKPHLQESNKRIPATVSNAKTAPTPAWKATSSLTKVRNLSTERPSTSTSKPIAFESRNLPLEVIENKMKDPMLSEEIGKHKVSETIKLFERNAEETSRKKPVQMLRSKSRPRTTAGATFSYCKAQVIQNLPAENLLTSAYETERLSTHSSPRRIIQEKESDLWPEPIYLSSSPTNAKASPTQENRLSPFQDHRPVGGVPMYTSQGPQLIQEIKDRFRQKYGFFYLEPEPTMPQSQSPPIQWDSSVLPRVDLSLEEVPNLAALPKNLDKDFSHILPSVLKERPKRAGRPPTNRITQSSNQVPSETSKASTATGVQL